MDGSIGVVLLAAIGATMVAAIGSGVNQARRGERADPRKPWRWISLGCMAGLVSTLSVAMITGWSVRSIGAVIPFAVLAPLALAGATGALHRTQRTDEP